MAGKKKEYHIGYCDILGVTNGLGTNHEEVEKSLDKAYSDMRRLIRLNNGKTTDSGEERTPFPIRKKIFSDNIVFSVESEGDDDFEIVYLLMFMSFFQVDVLKTCGLIMRGAVCRGEFKWGADYVIGQALVKAYRMEDKCAVYPRIIVETETAEKFLEIREKQPDTAKLVDIKKDTDGLYYIDYVRDLVAFAGVDGEVPDAYLDAAIKKSGVDLERNVSVAQKYNWLKAKVEEAKNESR